MNFTKYYSLFLGPEYGTTEAAWKAILVESDRRCDLHTRVKENLNIKVINQLKQWQKENYHKVRIFTLQEAYIDREVNYGSLLVVSYTIKH